MYLDVIESAVTNYRDAYPARKSNPSMKSDNLNIDDILSAHPMKAFKTTQRKSYIFDTDDVVGSKRTINRPPKDEIEYSRPVAVGFKTKRALNPLCPKYILPSYKDEPVEPPKLLRETNVLSDIEGSCPSSGMKKTFKKEDFLTKYTNPEVVQKGSAYGPLLRTRIGNVFFSNELDSFYQKRSNFDKSDSNFIEKTKDGKEVYNTLKVKDINNYRIFKTLRCTNPLEPEYVYDIPPTANKSEWKIGKIADSSPSKLPSLRKDRPMLSLQTKDINDDSSATYSATLKPHPPPSLIEGAKKGHFTTFAKSSLRHTHPLNPAY